MTARARPDEQVARKCSAMVGDEIVGACLICVGVLCVIRLPKSWYKYVLCERVCVRARVSARACTHACVHFGVCMSVYVCLCMYV